MIYLLDRDNLGQFCGSCTSSDTQIVQEVLALTGSYGNFSNPAYWNGLVYFGATTDYLRAFSISDGVLSTSPVSTSSSVFGSPGASPSISANGSTDGIVWALDSSQFKTPAPAVLHAYLATNLSDELYNSAQAANNRDDAGNAVKFTVPTVANGKVYIGTQTELDVYGLLP
jgi:outer membrane protein assembly factor BamB